MIRLIFGLAFIFAGFGQAYAANPISICEGIPILDSSTVDESDAYLTLTYVGLPQDGIVLGPESKPNKDLLSLKVGAFVVNRTDGKMRSKITKLSISFLREVPLDTIERVKISAYMIKIQSETQSLDSFKSKSVVRSITCTTDDRELPKAGF